jgi:SAM-dependent methyltransferase
MQSKQIEWVEEWSRFKDDSLFLFEEWILPNRLIDFKGKRVLDAGCGHGRHLRMVAPYAKEVVGVDLNTADIARQEVRDFPHVCVEEHDIAAMDFAEPFDMVYSVGVVHHTNDPTTTFLNLKRLTKKGGRLIVWVYSREGNFLNRTLLEWTKRLFLRCLPSRAKLVLSYALTLALYPVVWTFYLLPLHSVLPYYEYFSNFRRFPFRKNFQNVFDKIIAPQTVFINEATIRGWFNAADFIDIHISWYKGVSWRASGTKR